MAETAKITLKVAEIEVLRDALSTPQAAVDTGQETLTKDYNRLHSTLKTFGDAILDAAAYAANNSTFDIQENDWLYVKARFSEPIWCASNDERNAIQEFLALTDTDFTE